MMEVVVWCNKRGAALGFQAAKPADAPQPTSICGLIFRVLVFLQRPFCSVRPPTHRLWRRDGVCTLNGTTGKPPGTKHSRSARYLVHAVHVPDWLAEMPASHRISAAA